MMVATRLWLRAKHKAGAFGLDDVLLIPAILSAAMFTTILVLGVKKYGTDRHAWDVPLETLEYTALMACTVNV